MKPLKLTLSIFLVVGLILLVYNAMLGFNILLTAASNLDSVPLICFVGFLGLMIAREFGYWVFYTTRMIVDSVKKENKRRRK